MAEINNGIALAVKPPGEGGIQYPDYGKTLGAFAQLQMSSAHAGLYNLQAARQAMLVNALQGDEAGLPERLARAGQPEMAKQYSEFKLYQEQRGGIESYAHSQNTGDLGYDPNLQSQVRERTAQTNKINDEDTAQRFINAGRVAQKYLNVPTEQQPAAWAQFLGELPGAARTSPDVIKHLQDEGYSQQRLMSYINGGMDGANWMKTSGTEATNVAEAGLSAKAAESALAAKTKIIEAQGGKNDDGSDFDPARFVVDAYRNTQARLRGQAPAAPTKESDVLASFARTVGSLPPGDAQTGAWKELLTRGLAAGTVSEGAWSKYHDMAPADAIKEVGASQPTGMSQPATITAKTPAQLEQEKNTVAQSQKTYNGLQASSSQYERDMKPYLELSKSILSRPEMYSGAAGNYMLDWNRVRAALGDSQAAVLQEALQKLTATSVLAQINQQRDQLLEAGTTGSRIFAQQVSLVEQAAPSISTTPSGNRFLVNVADRTGAFSSEITRQARLYIHDHGHLDPGFDQQISNYIQGHPIFSEKERADPRILGAPQAPNTIKSPDEANAWASSMGIKPGEPFLTPDGRVKYLPGHSP